MSTGVEKKKIVTWVLNNETDEGVDSGADNSVLSDSSLACLSRALDTSGLIVCMCLNISTRSLINIQTQAVGNQLKPASLTHSMLRYWRSTKRTSGVKDKYLVKELERALKNSGKVQLADVLTERFNENLNLNDSCLSKIVSPN